MGKNKKNYIPTFGEELANVTTHGSMAALALCALPATAIYAYVHGGIVAGVGVSIFMVSIFLMFLCSTLYHAMAQETRHKQIFKILDHIFIYVAIAGTYTPIAISVIGGWQGTVILILQWSMVVFGIFYKSLSRRSIPKISLTIYLVMGWTLVLFLPMILAKAGVPLLLLILGGGVFYSVGAVFYAMKGFKFHHMVWHLMINLGALAHLIGIVFFIY